jgi:hypothetical protein
VVNERNAWLVEVDPWVLAGVAGAVIVPIGVAIAFFVRLNSKVTHMDDDHKKELHHLKSRQIQRSVSRKKTLKG